ncbi:MAG: glycerol-3-phosphate 1-O-acyltransferase PlsY [Clostridium sp.]
MERLICLVIGYAFGLIQSGYLYGKSKNMDIRQYGSGNAGSTNVLRVMGKKAGAIVFLGDFFKAIIAICLVRIIFAAKTDCVDLLCLYTGLGVTLGHNFPIYLKFKGGKGIACMAGIMTAMDIRIALTCLVVFSAVVFFTKYVSLGSILLSITFFTELVIFGQMGSYSVAPSFLPEFYVLGAVLMCLAIWRHRANIKRLLSGTENKIGASKSK